MADEETANARRNAIAYRVVTQAAFLCDVALKDLNKYFVNLDGSPIYPDLGKANTFKQNLKTSNKRYNRSKSTAHTGRKGSQGNTIEYIPLSEEFDWFDYIQRKPHSKPFRLPKFTSEIYQSQFTYGRGEDEVQEDEDTGTEDEEVGLFDYSEEEEEETGKLSYLLFLFYLL
jgi:hypothetical protein